MSSPKPEHKDTQTAAAAAPAARAALLSQIDAALRPLADLAQAVPMRAYMLDQFAFLGIRASPRRQALRGLAQLSAWTAADLVRPVQMPERHVRQLLGKDIDRHAVDVADSHIPLAVARALGPQEHPVANGKTRVFGSRSPRELGKDGLVTRARQGQKSIRLLKGRQRAEVVVTKEGHRCDVAPRFAVSSPERNDEARGVETAIRRAGRAHDVETKRPRQRLGSIEPRRRVMVARDRDDVARWPYPHKLGEEVKPQPLGRARWGNRIEDIARDEERIRLVLAHRKEKPREELLVLPCSVVAMKALAEMPVGRVKDATRLHKEPAHSTSAR